MKHILLIAMVFLSPSCKQKKGQLSDYPSEGSSQMKNQTTSEFIKLDELAVEDRVDAGTLNVKNLQAEFVSLGSAKIARILLQKSHDSGYIKFRSCYVDGDPDCLTGESFDTRILLPLAKGGRVKVEITPCLRKEQSADLDKLCGNSSEIIFSQPTNTNKALVDALYKKEMSIQKLFYEGKTIRELLTDIKQNEIICPLVNQNKTIKVLLSSFITMGSDALGTYLVQEAGQNLIQPSLALTKANSGLNLTKPSDVDILVEQSDLLIKKSEIELKRSDLETQRFEIMDNLEEVSSRYTEIEAERVELRKTRAELDSKIRKVEAYRLNNEALVKKGKKSVTQFLEDQRKATKLLEHYRLKKEKWTADVIDFSIRKKALLENQIEVRKSFEQWQISKTQLDADFQKVLTEEGKFYSKYNRYFDGAEEYVSSLNKANFDSWKYAPSFVPGGKVRQSVDMPKQTNIWELFRKARVRLASDDEGSFCDILSQLTNDRLEEFQNSRETITQLIQGYDSLISLEIEIEKDSN